MAYPSIPSFVKDPQAVLDFNWDWSAWLGENETISSMAVSSDAGLSISQTSSTNDVVTAWLSGGTLGAYYSVACEIMTSAGRTDVRRISVAIRQR